MNVIDLRYDYQPDKVLLPEEYWENCVPRWHSFDKVVFMSISIDYNPLLVIYYEEAIRKLTKVRSNSGSPVGKRGLPILIQKACEVLHIDVNDYEVNPVDVYCSSCSSYSNDCLEEMKKARPPKIIEQCTNKFYRRTSLHQIVNIQSFMSNVNEDLCKEYCGSDRLYNDFLLLHNRNKKILHEMYGYYKFDSDFLINKLSKEVLKW